MAVIQLTDVNAGYANGNHVIENINLTVNQNDFVAVIGPNGGGKTTLLKVILGLIQPTSGVVQVFGNTPYKALSKIGYVPQIIKSVTFPISVLDVTLMGRLGSSKIFGRYNQNDKDIALDKLAQLGIKNLADTRIDRLSGGQKQRVYIARALVSEPELLLLDEPVASVDSATQESFYHLLSELNKNITIMLVTHDVGAVSSYIKSIACINKHLFSHGESISSADVAATYGCPFELITHGIPHRVLQKGGVCEHD